MKQQTAQFEGLESRRLMADMIATVNAAAPRQTIDGIGAAMTAGSQPAAYRSSSFYDTIVGDLGTSVVRSPLLPAFEPVNDNNDPNVINWSAFSDSGIAPTMEFFKQMQARGVKQFLLTVWSPPAWMKSNASSSHGGTLSPDMREEFAENISATIQRAKTKWGVTITHVSIANEPWFVEPYRSAIYTPVQYREALKAVDARLQRDGLDVKMVGPEDVSRLYRTDRYLDAIDADPQADAALDIIGSHYLNGQDQAFLSQRATTMGKGVWYTELGNGDATMEGAMALVRTIDTSISFGGASGYINWLFTTEPGVSTFDTLMDGATPTKKYYALKHFARYVSPGSQLLTTNYSGDAVRVSTFKNSQTGAVSIVLSNDRDTPVNLQINFQNVASLPGGAIPASFRQFRTSATENTTELARITGANGMTVSLPSKSMVTLYSGPAFAAMPTVAAPPYVAPVPTSEGWNTDALRKASLQADRTAVASLIGSGSNVNAAFGNGWTPLFYAAASPYTNAQFVVSDLLTAGADRFKTDVEGRTALHIAAMNGNVAWGTPVGMPADRVKRLLQAGLNVNATDGYGRTPLHYAAMFAKVNGDLQQVDFDASIVKALLDAGANPSLLDSAGKTALDYARSEGFTAGIAALQAVTGQYVSVSGKFFIDTDQDGVLDTGEKGAGSRTVWIDFDNDNVIDANEPQQTAGVWGDYQFIELAPGTVRVKQVVPAGYRATTPSYVLNLTGGTEATNINFGTVVSTDPPPPSDAELLQAESATLTGGTTISSAHAGYTGSGFADYGGQGSAVEFKTTRSTAATLPLVFRYANGSTANRPLQVLVNGVLAGTAACAPTGSWTTWATVSLANIAIPAGAVTIKAIASTSAGGANVDSLAFTGGTVVPPPPPPPPSGTGVITGVVVKDSNANGVWNSGELGLANRTVWIDYDNDGIRDATEPTQVTASNGRYTFTGLAAGVYKLRQVLPAGWKQTRPAPGTAIQVTLNAGKTQSGYDFLTTT